MLNIRQIQVIIVILISNIFIVLLLWLSLNKESDGLNFRVADSRGHLEQIWWAVSAYHSKRNHLPAGTVSNGSLAPEQRLSWLAALSNYWDYKGLYGDIDFSSCWYCSSNQDFRNVNFLTDTNPRYRQNLGIGLNVYIAIGGKGVDSPTLPAGHARCGAFGYDRTTRLEDITDGLSTTMIVAESGQRNGYWLAGGPATLRGLDLSDVPYIGKGRQFGGLRPDSCLGLMADGSVRSISTTIDPPALEASMTIAGHDQVSQ